MAKTGFFAKVIKGLLIGGGTVLSIVSAGALAPVGISLIAAGVGIPIEGESADVISNYSTATAAALQAGQTTANVAKLPFSVQSLLSNPIVWVVAIGAVVLLIFKPFKRRKR